MTARPPQFRGLLDKRSFRSFRLTLQCLQKIGGGECGIEATSDGLLIRSLAPSHAAFALVTLKRNFFLPDGFISEPLSADQIPAPSFTPDGSMNKVYLKCKISLKQLMLIFRNSQQADQLELNIIPKENKIWCRFQVGGVRSTYGIPFESQSNILQADFHVSDSDQQILFKPQLLSKALDNFSANMTEVSFVIDPATTDGEQQQQTSSIAGRMLRLRNFEQSTPAHTAGLSLLQESIQTESDIPLTQLERFQLNNDTERDGMELTFNVKEVRAFLGYCESLGDHDVLLRWIESGAPIRLETKLRHHSLAGPQLMTQPADGDDQLVMQLVVATLDPNQSQSQQSTPQPINTQQQRQLAVPQPSPSFRQKQSAPMSHGEHDHMGLAPMEEEEVPPTPPDRME